MKKLVIFDFDGVIVESLDLWFRVTQSIHPELTKQDYIAMSHGNYIYAFEGKKLTYTDESLAEYRHNLLKIEMPPPVKSFIINHHDTYRFAIVSSGSESTIDSFLIKENIRQYFSDILGYETHKNKTIKLNEVMKKYGTEKNNAVFITDTLGDVMEAHEAGIKSIGVLWGLHDRETLERGNPEIIIDSPDSFEEAVEKVLNG